MAVRNWIVGQSLASYAGLRKHLRQLTEEEVLACLDVEAASLRRETVIDRLISRAVRLRELSYATHLKEKYRGTSEQDHDPR